MLASDHCKNVTAFVCHIQSSSDLKCLGASSALSPFSSQVAFRFNLLRLPNSELRLLNDESVWLRSIMLVDVDGLGPA